MWYFYLTPEKAAQAVAVIAGRADLFSWKADLLTVSVEKMQEKDVLESLADLGIFPCDDS